MEKSIISPDFTVEDIHKIREYHYEKRKDMPKEVAKEEICNNAMLIQKKIEEARERQLVNG